jgi:hypothetical protein
MKCTKNATCKITKSEFHIRDSYFITKKSHLRKVTKQTVLHPCFLPSVLQEYDSLLQNPKVHHYYSVYAENFIWLCLKNPNIKPCAWPSHMQCILNYN